MKQTILLIEDETDVLLSNQELLESSGYQVLTAENIREGWARLEELVPDLIILDVILPDGLGLDFCKKIRESHTVPVLFLSCLDEKHHIIEGLKIGGDDYITKPYLLEELLARCQALLRRVKLDTKDKLEKIQISSLMLDISKQKAYLSEQDILLTPKEFSLLLFLIRHPKEGFTAEQLYEAVWDMPYNEDVRTIKAHIYNLRKKLQLDNNNEFSITMSHRKYYIWNTKTSVKN